MTEGANAVPPADAQDASVSIATSEGSAQDQGSTERSGAVVGRRKDGRNFVQKNSLTEAELLAAREHTKGNLKRKAKAELTEEDKKEDRRAANRLSAFQSRQRRKMIIEDFQKTVAEQSKHNADQAKKIVELERQLQVARQENELLRSQLGSPTFPGAPLLGATGQFLPNPAQLMMAQPQFGMQQQENQLLQNAMLQNALLLSQAQQGGQPNPLNLLKELGLTAGQTSNGSGVGAPSSDQPNQQRGLSGDESNGNENKKDEGDKLAGSA